MLWPFLRLVLEKFILKMNKSGLYVPHRYVDMCVVVPLLGDEVQSLKVREGKKFSLQDENVQCSTIQCTIERGEVGSRK